MTTEQDPVQVRSERNKLVSEALKRKLQKTEQVTETLEEQITRLEADKRQLEQEKERLTAKVGELTSTNSIQQALLGQDEELMNMIADLLGPEIKEILAERENANKEANK